MEKQLDIKFLHDCLLIKDILVIGDLHFGYDGQIDGGSIFPGMQLKEIIEKLDQIFNYLEKEKIKVTKIVLLGDVKHDFGTITDIEWRETLEFFNYLNKKLEDMKISNLMIKDKIGYKALGNDQLGIKRGKDDNKGDKNKLKDKIIVVKGNHDNILKPIVKKIGIKLVDYYCVKIKNDDENAKINNSISADGSLIKKVSRGLLFSTKKSLNDSNKKNINNKTIKICFLHGDRLFKQCLDSSNSRDRCILFFGHLHPAITLYDKYKSEKYKCFLKGEWKINGKKEVYVLPSFSSFSLGYNLRDIDKLSETNVFSKEKDILNLFNKIRGKSRFVKKSKAKFYEIKKDKTGKDKFFVVPNAILNNFEVIVYNNQEKKEYCFGKLADLLKKNN